jgi:hypothetical protein
MNITKDFSNRCRSYTLECSTDVPGMVILVNICHKPGKHHVYIHGAEKRDLNPGVSYTYSPETDFNFRRAVDTSATRYSVTCLTAFTDSVASALKQAHTDNFGNLSSPIVAGFYSVLKNLIMTKEIDANSGIGA